MEGSSWKLVLPGFVRFPLTSSSTNICQICLKTASLASKSSSNMSKLLAVLMRGWRMSEIVTSPDSFWKIGRELSSPEILESIKSNWKIDPNGCRGCFLMRLILDRSIFFTNFTWDSMVPERCCDSVGARNMRVSLKNPRAPLHQS